MKELAGLGLILVLVSAVLAALGFRGREQVVGIDLGTTFSVVALKRKDQVIIVPDHLTGKPLLPSVVYFFPNGSTLVGAQAVAKRGTDPLQTIFNAKRFIGRRMQDATDDAGTAPYRVAMDPGNSTSNSSADTATEEPLVGFSVPSEDASSRWVSPIDVGANVVQHMKRSVAEFVGYSISRAVICVPAKFSPNQTKATQQAFEKAGFKVMRVLEEPTAAAVAYNLHKAGAVKHVLVYDLGGGTLDTSLLYMNGRSISLLGVAGDDHLGGSDFDLRMRTLLESRISEAQVLQEAPRETLQNCDSNGLGIIAEDAKIKLSTVDAVEVTCLAHDGNARRMTVTRTEFEAASTDLFDRSMAPVEKVLADQMMQPDNIDDIVLVGGASRTPKIRTLLKGYLGEGKRLHTEIDPDTVVAYGAANILD